MLNRYAGQALALFLVSAGAAYAGPAADNANEHFKAIAAGDVDAVMAKYGASPVLQWVGGPLDGAYAGDAIKDVWTKFTKAQGKLELKVSDVVEHSNPKGTTVTANVQFTGKAPIKVYYVLVYRDGKLVNETWQIDPSLMVSY
jgi:hypothetical protein